jgi:cytochrome c-type biogenesis protein CcmE
MDNSEKLINKIKEGNVQPVPRWRFTVKDAAAWCTFCIAVVFGALAFSVVLFSIQQAEFYLLEHMSHSLLEFLLALIPLIWIILLLVFLVAAIISIRNSKKGYKFSSLSLIGLCASISILLGTFFFMVGGGKWLENVFDNNVSVYESVQERKTKLWSMPEDGYLSGSISSIQGDSMKLEDFQGKNWTIEINHTDVVPSVSLENGEMIKIIGKMTSDDTFIAEKIRPWGSGERMKGNKNNK